MCRNLMIQNLTTRSVPAFLISTRSITHCTIAHKLVLKTHRNAIQNLNYQLVNDSKRQNKNLKKKVKEEEIDIPIKNHISKDHKEHTSLSNTFPEHRKIV